MTFLSKNINIKKELTRDALGILIFLIVLFFYNKIVPINMRAPNFIFVIILITTPITFFIHTIEKVIYKIEFDDTQKAIIFQYKNLLKKETLIIIPYKICKVEISFEKSLFSFFRKTTTLHFLKDGLYKCVLNSRRDRFTEIDIENIHHKLQLISIEEKS